MHQVLKQDGIGSVRPGPGVNAAKLSFDVKLDRAKFDLHAKHDLTLDGITALYGQNGSGKTTLLRVLAGLEPAAHAMIRFNGETWQSGAPRTMVPAHKRGIGFVFQAPQLFPHLNVAGNLAYAERRAGVPEDAISRAAVIDALDLAPLLDNKADALSGGERQRVALARTLLSRPRLLLMDEPLSAVDNRRRQEILGYIAKLQSLSGIPTLYVTHALDEVVRLAGNMLVLSEGRIAASGPTEDILERLDLAPATGRFEAGVVLRARIHSHDAAYQLTALTYEEARPGSSPEPQNLLWVPLIDAAVGTELRLRIRARDVSLATVRPEAISMRNVITGRLAELNVETDTAFAETLIDIGAARLRARLTRKSVDELELSPGRQVYALIKSISFDRVTPLT